MKPTSLLALAFCSVALAQNGSVLPPDLQEQVDRIRRESHLKTDPVLPPEPPPTAPPKTVELDNPAETAADLQDMQLILDASATVPLDRLETSSELQAKTGQKLKDMVAAAQRRVDRAEAKLARAKLAAQYGQIGVGTLQDITQELWRRRQTLDLGNERAALLGELIEMAQAEVIRPHGARMLNAATLRYDGSGRLIRPAEFAALSTSFARKFARPLPVSAWGASMTHFELGFDHRGRIDVAVYPDSREGLFIRAYLENLHIPYFAFRHAMMGRATGPHIHIGPGSVRLVRASLRASHPLQ